MKLSSLENWILKTFSYLPIQFSNASITKSSHQKRLGIALDSKVNFNTHADLKIKMYNKQIGIIIRLSANLPRNALLAIFKYFIRPHLGYGDVFLKTRKLSRQYRKSSV